MDKEDKAIIKIIITILVGILFISTLGWIFQSYQEAKSFNSVTGKNVSTWDAMWIELRVQDNATLQ